MVECQLMLWRLHYTRIEETPEKWDFSFCLFYFQLLAIISNEFAKEGEVFLASAWNDEDLCSEEVRESGTVSLRPSACSYGHLPFFNVYLSPYLSLLIVHLLKIWKISGDLLDGGILTFLPKVVEKKKATISA